MGSKRASVLMVVLWVLAILVIFAVSLGRRTAIFLSLAKHQRDRLAAYCLAKGALNSAIQELTADNTAGCDCLNDNWANKGRNSFAGDEAAYAITDEDRKLSVSSNPAGIKKLAEVFKSMGLTEDEAEELKNIFLERMNAGNGKLIVLEEALVMLEYFYQKNGEPEYQAKAQESFNRFQALATVYSKDNRININTASQEALAILAGAIAEDEAQKRNASALAQAIIALRQAKICFTNMDELNEAVASQNQSQARLLEELKPNLKLTSGVFKIEATAKAKNVTRNITVIYQRNSRNIIGWHQNN